MVKCPRCGYENSSSSKYCDNCAFLLSDSDGKLIKVTKRRSSWNMGMGKKIVIVLGIIVIALLLFSLIYNATQPSNQESLNVVTDGGSSKQSSSYPYKVLIDYNGSWYVEMGDPNYLLTESGKGTKSFQLDCSSWDKVYVNVQKYGGNGELKVKLLRNGNVVGENTTNGTGSVKLTYNY